MELRQIRYAIAVAEELHFGRAAERLLVAQPSLSRQIRDLERDLGVDLFERTSRQVRLTAAGAAFLDAARRAVSAVDSSREAAVDAASGISGTVTLGFVASAAIQILPELVRQHSRARPRVRLTLKEMTTEEQIAALHEGAIDVGLSRDLEEQEGITVRAVLREPLIAVVPSTHPLHHRHTIDIRDLADSQVVTLPRARVPRAWDRLVVLAHDSGTRLHFAQEANQFATLLALVAAEVGVAVVPASVRALRQDGVHYLRLRDEGAWTDVCAVVRDDNISPTAQDLQAVLQERFNSEG
ncbi:LysR family transcriptional regulator [Nocardioides panzhihuensis]|uniref:DNA-binding transcriptional LysR family regulator n=1 Tax=Nocardioides panzhihuensis TaxID=860243 RepID=A0A7Z0DMX7_9ACTN|nr:LysR family transcriptional regulator [Nocardioides panzhihuensis]NYI78443.1 DNA-binding transcriptional LysR family regulator [Nocardioides panzhihuensis]